MPLQHSSSPGAFKSNVKTLMDEYKAGTSKHVQSPQQALAISYAIKRRGKANGGKVKGYDTGGATDPVNAVISALQTGSNQGTVGAGIGSNPGMNTPSPATTPTMTTPTPAGATSPTPLPSNTGLGSGPGLQPPSFNLMPSPPATQAPLGGLQTQLPPAGNKLPGMAFGGMPPGSMGQVPWFVKRESQNLTHTGPVMSAVPGRTDRHNVSVPSSSYVFPADFVSHLGQNNSQAGMKILGNMGFGSGGPPTGMKMPRGPGAPRPPRPMGIPGDKGGARGDGQMGAPTPVVIAGGEFVSPPESIMHVLKTNDIKHAHSVLDSWVMKVRKDHIKTLKGLPPPAKA
jgi:hypothetical protein